MYYYNTGVDEKQRRKKTAGESTALYYIDRKGCEAKYS